jgi:hypothetical protein
MKPNHATLAVFALAVALLASPRPLAAWPNEARSDIFTHASRTLPPALGRLLSDMESVLAQPCESGDATNLEAAATAAVRELRSPNGDLARAIDFIRESGCAAAALNDPGSSSIDALVNAQKNRFAVVFYGWHPLVQTGDLPAYLAIRAEEHGRLMKRFDRSSELPSLSDQVELSPAFGLASIAFSHAVTDVANVWLYIWTEANGAR